MQQTALDRPKDIALHKLYPKIQPIAPLNKEDVVTDIGLRALTEGLDKDSRKEIFKAVINVPTDEGGEVVRNAVYLMSSNMGWSKRVRIIQTVADIPVNEKDEVIALAQKVITPPMPWFAKIEIVKAVTGVPAQKRTRVVKNTVYLITKDTEWFERAELIRMVALLPVSFNEPEFALAQKVIAPGMGNFSKIEIVNAMIDVPAHDRADVIQHTLQLMDSQTQAIERGVVIRVVARLAADQRADYVQRQRGGGPSDLFLSRLVTNDFNRLALETLRGINVDLEIAENINVNNEGNRSRRVKAAIELLREHQGEMPGDKIDEAVLEFMSYLNGCQNCEYKKLALHALLAPQQGGRDFGPLINKNQITIMGLKISGEEVIARLWVFASKLTELDQTLAKDGIIFGLKESCEEKFRVCNPGKVERLITAVLQGRLPGVEIELMTKKEVSTGQAMEMFFYREAHRGIEQLEPLLDAANRFCDENPAVNRTDFIREIIAYAQAGGFGYEDTEVS